MYSCAVCAEHVQSAESLGSRAEPLSFSAVIPVRNHAGLAQRLLDSLEAHAPAALVPEIIVVDDGSTEDLTPLLRKYPRVKTHRFEVSAGPAAARNHGAAMAASPVLFLFDADVVCPPQLFETAARILETNPDAAAVSFINQPYDPNANDVENYTAVLEDYWFTSVFSMHPDPAPAEGMMTRCGAIRRSVFESLGGFDPAFRTNAHEDFDFGKRLVAQHLALVTNAPRVYHSYPNRLGRQIRNTWVRTVLFVPYFLEHRPPLGKMQVTPLEGLTRINGLLTALFAALALLVGFLRPIWALIALVCLAAYLQGLRRILAHAWVLSRRPLFVAKVAGMYWVLSIVTVAAGCWGLLQFWTRASAHELRSPVRISGKQSPGPPPQD